MKSIEARFNGGAWQTIAANISGDWSGTLTSQAQGQGDLEIRYTDQSETVTISSIGIGDVFIIAGQSNGSGRGDNPQSYSHASLVARSFTNAYSYQELTDPTDSSTGQVDLVSADGSAAGSPWPLLATTIMADQGVPVMFIPCARSATFISQWQPTFDHFDRTKLYGSMAYRGSLQPNGVKAVLWHQGEAESGEESTTQAGYNASLDTLANTLATDLGTVLMPCKIQNNGGVALATVNAAIGEAWADNANVLAGPDFSDLELSPDANHFTTDAHLQTAADRWWTALQAAFYS